MKSMNYSLIRTICALVIGLVLVLWPDAAINYIVITIGILFLIPGFIVLIGYFGTKPEPVCPAVSLSRGWKSALRTLAGYDAGLLCRCTDVPAGLYPDYGRRTTDCIPFDGTSLDACAGRLLCDTGPDPDSGCRSPVQSYRSTQHGFHDYRYQQLGLCHFRTDQLVKFARRRPKTPVKGEIEDARSLNKRREGCLTAILPLQT